MLFLSKKIFNVKQHMKTIFTFFYPLLLLSCAMSEHKPSLADVDIKGKTGETRESSIQPKSSKVIREAYSSYLKNTNIDDTSRLNALSRLAELELKFNIDSLQQDDDTEEKNHYFRLNNTIKLLKVSLKEHPKSKNNDILLYQLAKLYDQTEQHNKSTLTLNKLIDDFPKSKFYAEAQFRIAEDSFSNKKYNEAEYAYTETIISRQNKIFYEKSLFKRGWSRFKQNYYSQAIDDFFEATMTHGFDEYEKLSSAELDQFTEYFRAIGLAFSYMGGADSLYSYFKDQPDFIYTYHSYSMVSEIYEKQERYSDAVKTHIQFIKQFPHSENIPYSRLKIIKLWKDSGFVSNIYNAIEEFYTLYNPSSEYWKNQNNNSRVNRAIRRSLKEYIVLMTSHFHNQYQNIVNLVIASIWVSMKGGDGGMLIWGSVSFIDNWLAAFVVVLAGSIWMSPFIGWFLLVSAYTKRSPLLMAFMPLILIGLLEGIILRSHVFAENVLARGDGLPIFRTVNIEKFFEAEEWRVGEGATNLLTHLDIVRFLTSPEMWAGVLVCALLSTGAIYVRRFRDES